LAGTKVGVAALLPFFGAAIAVFTDASTGGLPAFRLHDPGPWSAWTAGPSRTAMPVY